ncbi:NAD-dependent epimerase/dehydratase family protein, partial [Vibrio diabolicus]|nr:NAD-dependent epimerase/dehydratase family protein [Vibrio diabolicus]
MNIVITGGAGFLGAMLAQTLLHHHADTIESLTVVDRVAPNSAVTQDSRVKAIVADITDPQQVET